jgi:hypothetical protein
VHHKGGQPTKSTQAALKPGSLHIQPKATTGSKEVEQQKGITPTEIILTTGPTTGRPGIGLIPGTGQIVGTDMTEPTSGTTKTAGVGVRELEVDCIEHVLNGCKELTSKFKVYSKSGMENVEQCQKGRPFGGVAIACKLQQDITFSPLETNSNRIVAVGDPSLTAEYIDTIDSLQCFIDSHGALAPIKIMGDFNAQQPRGNALNHRWYKQKGFTVHSSILYDFITANKLFVI